MSIAPVLNTAWNAARSSYVFRARGFRGRWDYLEAAYTDVLEAGAENVPARFIELLGLLDDVSSLDPGYAAAWTALTQAFAAGLFRFWVLSAQVICVPRPSLWIANGRLHRPDGPAVEWPSEGDCLAERYWFWRGVHVPQWVIEAPEGITLNRIEAEHHLEVRRCMIERYGIERFMREAGTTLVSQDEHGRLWRFEPRFERGYLVLEVENGSAERDGTRRRYFLNVPPTMRTPRQAVAGTYGLSARRYALAVRT